MLTAVTRTQKIFVTKVSITEHEDFGIKVAPGTVQILLGGKP
jgi:hypothetical protein